MGGKFDFSEFDRVIDGKTAPLFDKAMKLSEKFGTDDMFILTARSPNSAKAIKEFLDAQGLKIPLKNITGLGQSEASAKANWIAEKVGEGYNDFYFADDAIQNVKAVKETLNKLFPNRKLNDLSVESYEWLNTWYSQKRSAVKPSEQKMLVDIYNEVFNSKRVVSNCSPCIASVNRELKKVYEAAEVTE